MVCGPSKGHGRKYGEQLRKKIHEKALSDTEKKKMRLRNIALGPRFF